MEQAREDREQENEEKKKSKRKQKNGNRCHCRVYIDPMWLKNQSARDKWPQQKLCLTVNRKVKMR